MGSCCPCFNNNNNASETHQEVDRVLKYASPLFQQFIVFWAIKKEQMRQLQAQAAEKRMKQTESRGIKNIESVKRQQAAKDQLESLQTNASRNDSGNMRVRLFTTLLQKQTKLKYSQCF